MTELRTDDFLDSASDPAPEGAAGGTDSTHGGGPRRRAVGAAATAGWLAAGVALGAVAVLAIHSSHSTAPTGPAAVTGNGPAGGFGGGRGGVAGEQHLFGTLGAVRGSTFSLTTSSGTTSYTIDASTALVKDGQQASSLAAMHAGDAVVVHVYPVNGKPHVEVVIDGADQQQQQQPPPGGTTTT